MIYCVAAFDFLVTFVFLVVGDTFQLRTASFFSTISRCIGHVKRSGLPYRNILVTRLDVYENTRVHSFLRAMRSEVMGLKADGRIDDRFVMGQTQFMNELDGLYDYFIGWTLETSKVLQHGLTPESVLYQFFTTLPSRTKLVSASLLSFFFSSRVTSFYQIRLPYLAAETAFGTNP
jgi:hypothetical protein